jgi:hypothetical protein
MEGQYFSIWMIKLIDSFLLGKKKERKNTNKKAEDSFEAKYYVVIPGSKVPTELV